MKVTPIQPLTSQSEMLKNYIPDKVSRSCLACQMSAVRVLKGRRGISSFVKKPRTAERSRNMAKNRVKQRAHLRCEMTKEERLQKEAKERQEELLEKRNYYGLDDPTPYQAVRNLIREGVLV